jgi:hypothetical protein
MLAPEMSENNSESTAILKERPSFFNSFSLLSFPASPTPHSHLDYQPNLSFILLTSPYEQDASHVD